MKSALAAALFASFLAIFPQAAFAENAFALKFVEARENLFPSSGAKANIIPNPEKGELVAICRFDDSAFAITSLEQLSVESPSGGKLPLIIETESVWEEFGEIVSLRFAFSIKESDLNAPRPFVIKWGVIPVTRTDIVSNKTGQGIPIR